MKYFVMDLENFYKRFSYDLAECRKDVLADEQIYLSYEDLQPFFDNAIVLVAMEGEEIAGAVCTIMCKEPTNPVMYGTNMFLYVKKPWRNSSVPGRLIKGTEKICKEEGLSYYKWDVIQSSPLVQCFEKRADYKKESIIFSKSL